ncbi:MAG: flippase-like domain-containing protein [Acidobacteria bacterium]|nr:flippase-like domain-containing protein [Acidobacteriota bacterium]
MSQIDLHKLPKTLSSLHLFHLVAAVAFGHLDRILMAVKWRLLVKPHSLSISLSDAITTTYMGSFAGQFLPAGLGSDIARVYLLRKINLPGIQMAASILIERVFGLYAHIVIAFVAVGIATIGRIYIPAHLFGTIIAILVFFSFALALSFMSWTESLMQKISEYFPKMRHFDKVVLFTRSYQLYEAHKRSLILFFLLSILEVVVATLTFYWVTRAMALNVTLIQLLVSVPIILTLARIPVSLNGIGVFEAMVGVFFVQFGESIHNAVTYGFLMRALEIFVFLPGGLLYLEARLIPT